MASFGTRAPAPVVQVDGVLRSLSTFTGSDKSSYPGREAGRASVLTHDGDGIPAGYLEVYITPDQLAALGELKPGPVSWVVEVESFTERNAERGTSWSRLSAKLVTVVTTVDMSTGEVRESAHAGL